MKNSILHKYIFGLLLVIPVMLFTGCKDDDVRVNNFIEVSEGSYEFGAGGGEHTFTVSPVPSGDWNATFPTGQDWLSEVSTTANTLTVKVAENIGPDADTRTAKITITSREASREITISQISEILGYVLDENGVAPRMVKFTSSQFEKIVISPNGKYVGGVSSYIGSDDRYYYSPVIIEIATGKRTEIAAMPDNSLNAQGISDNGEFLVDSWSPEYTAYICKTDDNGTITPITADGFTIVQMSGISADGFIWVGFGKKSEGDLKDYPIKWTNGVAEELETPSESIDGLPVVQGWQARGISGDGELIYGSEWDVMGAVYWDNSGKFNVMAEDLIEVEYGDHGGGTFSAVKIVKQTATNINLSVNGRYYASYYDDVDMETLNSEPERQYPFVMDMQDGNYIVMEDYPNHAALCANDDGLVSIGTPVRGSRECLVYDYKTDTDMGSANVYVKTKYGINLANNIIIDGFCGDGKTLLGRIVIGETMLGSIISDYFYIYYPPRN